MNYLKKTDEFNFSEQLRSASLKINMGQLLELCAHLYRDAEFVSMANSMVMSGAENKPSTILHKSLTYRQFNQLVNRMAHGLMSRGIQANDYVGIMMENSLEFLVFSYALKKIGAIEVSINNTFRGVSLSRMINLTGLKVLLISDSYLAALSEIKGDLQNLESLIVEGDVQVALELGLEYDLQPLQSVISDVEDNCTHTGSDQDTAVILFTSGTTGVSKGCEIPHRSSIRAAQSMLEAFAITENDCVYSPYPLFHCGAAQYDVLAAMMAGARVVLRDGFSLRHFWSDVTHHDVSWFMCLGSVQQLLWAREPDPLEKSHKMRFIWGTPLPVDADAFEHRFNVKVVRGGGYGSTDAGSVALPLFD
ncbi:MAG: AMP-binding protein, partial [Alphaproteobacteria bacterium]|nr:AMP-binding protein [Alphaproteobacteria bacterium]